MKIPDTIKKAIIECAEANNKEKMNDRIITRWLEEMKLTAETATDTTRDMTDCYIDYCKMSYNPDEFIEVLENL